MRQLLLIIILSSIFSCKNDDGAYYSYIGEDYISTSTRVILIDSITIKSATFKFDSLNVSSPKRLLSGSYDDPVFGKIKSQSFVKMVYSDFNIDNTAEFDSIALILKPDSYYYNDTIPNQKINVFEILDEMEPLEDKDEGITGYFNSSQFNYNPVSIGSLSFSPRPIRGDSLTIKINDDFGLSLFEKIKSNEIDDANEFTDAFKGLLISPDNSNTALFGFKNNAVLKLYYSTNNETNDIETSIDIGTDLFNISNNTEANTIGTPFNTLTQKEVLLESNNLNNLTYVQSGTGITTRIDLPYLKELHNLEGKGFIISAKLTLPLKKEQEYLNLNTKDSINLKLMNHKFDVLSSQNYPFDDSKIAYIDQQSTEFNVFNYSYDITDFINLKLNEDLYNTEFYLFINPPDFNLSTDRYIFYDSNHSGSKKMKVELIYALYDED